MRFLRRSLVGLFLLAVTLALFGLAGRTVYDAVQVRANAEPRSFPQREQVTAVNVLPYAPQSVTPVLEVFGDLRSQRTLDIRASVGGTIIEVAENFAEGGHVEAGELLVQIDRSDAEAALARTRVNQQNAEAELRDADRALELARDELTAAEDQVALREQALVRQQGLSERGIATASDLETAELAVSSARSTVLTRRGALANAEARVDQAHTSLAALAIDLAEAERTLADTVITAAFTGTLSEVSVIEGGRVTANELLAQLVDPERLEVAFRVSTAQYARLLDDSGRLRPAEVAVTLDVSGVDLRTTGTLSRESASVAEGQTGRLLFARLDSAPGFRPGDFVTISVAEPALDGVAVLPATAVAADETVLVVGEDQRLSVGNVELLRRQGDDVIVRGDGLDGALVVAARSPLLGAGIKVRPILPDGSSPEGVDQDPAVARGPPGDRPQGGRPEGGRPEGGSGEVVQLDPARRARLVSFVEGSRMPDDAKSRILLQLEADEVPAEVVSRLESRMGS